jgi:hypothetical protein
MSSDLLFSILPRLGKVAITHSKQKVLKIPKKNNLKPLNDKEQELTAEHYKVQEEQEKQEKQEKQQSALPDDTNNAMPPFDPQLSDSTQSTDNKPKSKGPKHLDLYV